MFRRQPLNSCIPIAPFGLCASTSPPPPPPLYPRTRSHNSCLAGCNLHRDIFIQCTLQVLYHAACTIPHAISMHPAAASGEWRDWGGGGWGWLGSLGGQHRKGKSVLSQGRTVVTITAGPATHPRTAPRSPAAQIHTSPATCARNVSRRS